jgi:hypothetical protein
MGTRKRRERITRRASASLLALLLTAFLVIGCGDPGETRDAVEARMAQLLVEQSQLRQFLEVDFYGIGEDVEIYTPDPSGISPPGMVILRNGRLDIPAGMTDKAREALTEYEPQIVAVFKEFGCSGLALVTDRNQIQMIFGREKIDGALYGQWLMYPNDTGMATMVYKDWYYLALPIEI